MKLLPEKKHKNLVHLKGGERLSIALSPRALYLLGKSIAYRDLPRRLEVAVLTAIDQAIALGVVTLPLTWSEPYDVILSYNGQEENLRLDDGVSGDILAVIADFSKSFWARMHDVETRLPGSIKELVARPIQVNFGAQNRAMIKAMIEICHDDIDFLKQMADASRLATECCAIDGRLAPLLAAASSRLIPKRFETYLASHPSWRVRQAMAENFNIKAQAFIRLVTDRSPEVRERTRIGNQRIKQLKPTGPYTREIFDAINLHGFKDAYNWMRTRVAAAFSDPNLCTGPSLHEAIPDSAPRSQWTRFVAGYIVSCARLELRFELSKKIASDPEAWHQLASQLTSLWDIARMIESVDIAIVNAAELAVFHQRQRFENIAEAKVWHFPYAAMQLAQQLNFAAALGYSLCLPKNGRELRDFGKILRNCWQTDWIKVEENSSVLPILVRGDYGAPLAVLDVCFQDGTLQVVGSAGHLDAPLPDETMRMLSTMLKIANNKSLKRKS